MIAALRAQPVAVAKGGLAVALARVNVRPRAAAPSRGAVVLGAPATRRLQRARRPARLPGARGLEHLAPVAIRPARRRKKKRSRPVFRIFYFPTRGFVVLRHVGTHLLAKLWLAHWRQNQSPFLKSAFITLAGPRCWSAGAFAPGAS